VTRPGLAILAGLCATLLGVGLQRFAFGPIQPAMVELGWLTAGAAGVLGAASFLGYVIGVALAHTLARAIGLRAALRLAAASAVLFFALCAIRGPLAWFLPWRTMAGVSGGVLMILAGPAVQAVVPAAMRGRAAGLMFLGPGGGIVIAGLLVPVLLPFGLPATWLALAGAAAFLTALSWPLWPDVPAPTQAPLSGLPAPARRLVATYGLVGIATMPHMQWWADYVARGLGRGVDVGATHWLIYGLGAVGVPFILGAAADRIGVPRMFRILLLVETASQILPLIGTSDWILTASGLCAGAGNIGLTSMTLARAPGVAGPAAPAVWRAATLAFAIATFATGFLLAAVYKLTGSHLPLFAIGAAGGVAAMVVGRK
jgi:predicted MFS family arabinose efflux permease